MIKLKCILTTLLLFLFMEIGKAKESKFFNLEHQGMVIGSLELYGLGGIKSIHSRNNNLVIINNQKNSVVECYLLDDVKVQIHNQIFSKFTNLESSKLSIVINSQIPALELAAKNAVIKYWKFELKDDDYVFNNSKMLTAQKLDFWLRQIIVTEKELKLKEIKVKNMDKENNLDKELLEKLREKSPLR